jgi:hypothetical protein
MSELVVVTVLMPTTTVSYIGASSYLCDFCNVTLIKSLNVEDKFNSIKHQERGQTIRSSSSGGNNNEGTPFVEIIRSNNKDSSLKGTQVSRSLLQQNNNNFNDLEPNEDAILRGQGYKILRKEITSADGQRKMS